MPTALAVRCGAHRWGTDEHDGQRFMENATKEAATDE